MMLGPYSLSWGGLATLVRMSRDARRVRRSGIPRSAEGAPAEVARVVLRANAGRVLAAGAGHFHAMWTADLGVAFRGALTVLPRDYLSGLLARITRESARLGRVPTCFTERAHFDAPWPRADGAPWLLHAVDALVDADFLAAHERDLARVFSAWERAHVDPRTRLVRRDVTGDWMDTVPRPSSTYNNLCALRAYEVAGRLGLPAERSTLAESAEALLEARLAPDGLADHEGADPFASGDASALALYFGFFPEKARETIASHVAAAGLHRPVPLRARERRFDPRALPLATRLAPTYHSTIWLHLGLFYAIGLARLGVDATEPLARIEDVVRRHGTFLETLEPDGSPHVSRLVATEYGFTMSAGLYLEALSVSRKPAAR